MFRQQDEAFVSMLRHIRNGGAEATAALRELVQKCSRPLEPKNGIVPTVFYSRCITSLGMMGTLFAGLACTDMGVSGIQCCAEC